MAGLGGMAGLAPIGSATVCSSSLNATLKEILKTIHSYQRSQREPTQATVTTYTVITVPPPNEGGYAFTSVCLAWPKEQPNFCSDLDPEFLDPNHDTDPRIFKRILYLLL